MDQLENYLPLRHSFSATLKEFMTLLLCFKKLIKCLFKLSKVHQKCQRKCFEKLPNLVELIELDCFLQATIQQLQLALASDDFFFIKLKLDIAKQKIDQTETYSAAVNKVFKNFRTEKCLAE